MKCPECNSSKLKITDSRYYDSGLFKNTKKRKRKCQDCGCAFHSFELCYPQGEIEKILKALENTKWKVRWSDEEDRQLVEMYKKQYRTATIAANLGRSHEAVRKRIIILGLAEII